MKFLILSLLFCVTLFLGACSTTQQAQAHAGFVTVQNDIATVQDSPTTQDIEDGLITAAASVAGQPELAFLASPAVSGLTDGVNAVTGLANPTAVTGANVSADAALITSTVTAAFPKTASSKAVTVAKAAASAYTAIMTAPGVALSPATANAAIAVIAQSLTPTK